MLQGRKAAAKASTKPINNCRITFRLHENTVADFKRIAKAKQTTLDRLGREAIGDLLKKHKVSMKKTLLRY